MLSTPQPQLQVSAGRGTALGALLSSLSRRFAPHSFPRRLPGASSEAAGAESPAVRPPPSLPPCFPQRHGRRVAVRRSRRVAAGRRRARWRRRQRWPRSVGRCPAGGAVAARAALGSSGSCAARSPRAPAILAPAPQPLRLVPPSPPGAAQPSPAGDGTRAPPPGGERGSEAGRSREGAGPAALLRQPPWRGGPAAPEAGAHARTQRARLSPLPAAISREKPPGPFPAATWRP